MPISATFDDTCRQCGASIPDDGGCIYAYWCDACCRAARHPHPWLQPARISAAAPSVAMQKQTVPLSQSGIGGSKPDDSPLSQDPEYQRALAAGDSAALARIAHGFGKKK